MCREVSAGEFQLVFLAVKADLTVTTFRLLAASFTP